jgi:D-Lysine 5,6-aminomutase TIM-barrel domain of alpha subunit
MTDGWGPLDKLVERADSLAATMGARARASTSVGQERAILRLFGVSGLDRGGRPLAGATVDRWMRSDPRGLGAGIALPFAMALLEYDLDPAQLALDVASGAVDLALEAELLNQSDRRHVAEVEAGRLAKAAIERIDADRTASREILGLLGDAPRPWVGMTLTEPDLEGALDEVGDLVASGVDILRIEVPVGRELADRLHDTGQDVPEWRPGDRGSRPSRPGPIESAPTGSQRALAQLRRAADGLAAQRRGYVRLATTAPALWSPEDAVVAAFERIDIVESDPMAEIVATGIDPDRALSDHAFAHRLHRRSGTLLTIGAGSLVVAPDIRVGIPSDPATRGGRALALQLLAVALARNDGVPDEQLAVAALPPWSIDEPAAGARAIAEVAVRRALYPDNPLAFSEPDAPPDRAAAWPHMLAAVLVRAGDVALVVRRPGVTAAIARDTRAAGRVAAEVAGARERGSLSGVALDHARGATGVALATLDMIADRGWQAISGDAPEGGSRAIGGDAVADRTETFDPFEALLGRVD